MDDKGTSGGSVDSDGKQGTWLEGEESRSHTHNDGTHGTDIEAFRNTYKDGKVVDREKASDWGKIHEKDGSSGK